MKVIDFDVRSKSEEHNQTWIEAFHVWRKGRKLLYRYKKMRERFGHGHAGILKKAERAFLGAKELLKKKDMVNTELNEWINLSLREIYSIQVEKEKSKKFKPEPAKT